MSCIQVVLAAYRLYPKWRDDRSLVIALVLFLGRTCSREELIVIGRFSGQGWYTVARRIDDDPYDKIRVLRARRNTRIAVPVHSGGMAAFLFVGQRYTVAWWIPQQ